MHPTSGGLVPQSLAAEQCRQRIQHDGRSARAGDAGMLEHDRNADAVQQGKHLDRGLIRVEIAAEVTGRAAVRQDPADQRPPPRVNSGRSSPSRAAARQYSTQTSHCSRVVSSLSAITLSYTSARSCATAPETAAAARRARSRSASAASSRAAMMRSSRLPKLYCSVLTAEPVSSATSRKRVASAPRSAITRRAPCKTSSLPRPARRRR
jgi:hypothetical protein